MKNKILAIFLLLSILLCFSSCSMTKKTPPPDLTGNWKQINIKSSKKYQVATIDDDTIKIYWVSEDEPIIMNEYKTLFWAGSFIPPTTSKEPYTWESQSDYVQDGNEIVVSRMKSKTFTYNDNKISYEISSNGKTYTVVLERTL